jgi:hypothetical protein
MPVSGIERRKNVLTQEAVPHHVFSTAHALGYPFHVLTRAKSEFKLNMVQEVKSVTVKNVKTCAGCLFEIIQLFLLHSRCRFWASTFQSPTS